MRTLRLTLLLALLASAALDVPDIQVARAGEGGVLTLKEAFQRALVRSDTLAIAEQDIKIAEAHYLQALGTALPHLTSTTTELIQDTSGGSGDGSVGQTFTRRSRPEVKITLTQPLFQGFREFTALKAAGAEKMRDTLRVGRARQLLFADVARAYYTVLDLEHEIEILNSLRGTLQKHTGELNERIRLGKSRASELLATEAEIAINEAEIERTKGLVLTARDYLGFLVGEPVSAKLVDEFQVPSKTPALETLLEGRDQRPDIGASQESVRLSKGLLDFEKGGRYPTLDFEANYYPYRVGFQSDIDWDLNFALTVPIFRGGLTRGKIREAAAELKQSEFASSETDRHAALEIRQALNRLTTTKSREAALRRAETKSAANYRSQVEEYGFGLVNNLDVLLSLRVWQERRLEANRSHYETKLEYLNLLVATGNMSGFGDLQ
jgi:outer membrane protein